MKKTAYKNKCTPQWQSLHQFASILQPPAMYLFVVVSLQQTGVCGAAISASGEKGVLLAFTDQSIRSSSSQTDAGRAEGVSKRQRAALCIHLSEVHRTNSLAAFKALLSKLIRSHGVNVGQHLSSERFVELNNTHIAQLQVVSTEDLAGGIGRTLKK